MTIDFRILALCLISALIWIIIGVVAFDIGVAEAIKVFAMMVASFYFGRWVKRNGG